VLREVPSSRGTPPRVPADSRPRSSCLFRS
jgi:hypothetical protein